MEALVIKLNRQYKKDEYTIGKIYVDGKYLCDSLEDKDYGFTKETPVATIQEAKKEHPQQVAIPAGRYEISTEYYRGMATRYPFYRRSSCKGNIPCLVGVPGYSGILIHCGSTAKDSAGCILVGFNKKKGALTDSKRAFTLLCDKIMEAKKQGRKVYIDIE